MIPCEPVSDTKKLSSEGSLGARHTPTGYDTEPDGSDGAPVKGRVLSGRYRLVEEIGRGGMGSVWRAERLGWQATVAVKLMTRTGDHKPGARKRFEREVRLAAGLRSPHVVQVLDHGVDEETDTPYLVMELLEGESLATHLRHRGRLSTAETLSIVTQLCRALTRAHREGIVHRDLKPDNVFLVSNDEETLVKVLDFGVAKWIAPTDLDTFETRPGSLVGSPLYMSPEQLQTNSSIDHRADLWSLAVIVCECLTGKRPFSAPDFASLAVLLCGHGPRPDPSTLGPVPVGFDTWFRRATSRTIEERFQTAQLFTEALRVVFSLSASDARAPIPSLSSGTSPSSQSLSSPNLGTDSLAPTLTPRLAGLTTRRWQRIGLGVGLGFALTALVLLNFDGAASTPQTVSALRPPQPPSAPQEGTDTSAQVNSTKNTSSRSPTISIVTSPAPARTPDANLPALDSQTLASARSAESQSAKTSSARRKRSKRKRPQAAARRKTAGNKASRAKKPNRNSKRPQASAKKARATSPDMSKPSNPAVRVNGHRIRTLLKATPK